MNTLSHGGMCCGITHIQGFAAYYEEGNLSKERVDSHHNNTLTGLDSYLKQESGYLGRAKLAEVVLRDGQNKVWGNVLINRGFKLVNSFFNNNSGNNVYIYHKAPPTRPEGEQTRPFVQHEELLVNPEVVRDWGTASG